MDLVKIYDVMERIQSINVDIVVLAVDENST
jgi:hypothetical protein